MYIQERCKQCSDCANWLGQFAVALFWTVLVKKREQIFYHSCLEQSKKVMQEEIKDYFEIHQPEIVWTDFWEKCEKEL